MAKDLDCTVADLMARPEIRTRIDIKRYVSETVGMPTITDIVSELAKPGRDPRKQFEAFSFADGVHKASDLQPGMRLPGIVTNVAAFGAFVDVGVHQDGLVHVSELSDHFVKNPADVVKVQQKVMVTVISVDLDRNRIALSLKTKPAAPLQSQGGAPGSGQRDKTAAAGKNAKQPSAQDRHGGQGSGGWFSDLLKSKKDPK
jgi:uncharacterized protein